MGKRIGLGVLALFAVILVLGALAPDDAPVAATGEEALIADGASASAEPSSVPVATSPPPTAATTTAPAPVPTTKPPAPSPTKTQSEPELTLSQENAIEKAESYLEFTAFSESGLVNQLKFEGFPTADAQFAVDYLDIDWFEQAAKKAQEYLDFGAFSRQGLIDQLVFEGFTREQATYGVDQTGL